MHEDVAIRRIKNLTDTFYTLVNGRCANIIIAVHNGREYLKTEHDNYRPDNLPSLSDCVTCTVIS